MLDKTLRWRPFDESGLQHLRIRENAEGITFRAALVTQDAGYFYRGTLDRDWIFRTFTVERTDGATLTLNADGRGNWSDAHGPRSDLADCLDIDISGSPFTNTLPIRRVGWETGKPRHLEMA